MFNPLHLTFFLKMKFFSGSDIQHCKCVKGNISFSKREVFTCSFEYWL